jgi:Bacterial aa3 type cytochrome c oxidase subunit IV
MGIDTAGGHPSMDYAQHTGTYKTFLTLTKYSVIFCVLLLIGMAYFLV